MIDVSPRALSIARMIDRLQAGTFIIELIKPDSKTERWIICVKQPVTIRTMSLDQSKYTTEKKDTEMP